jgi:hypothetical protein
MWRKGKRRMRGRVGAQEVRQRQAAGCAACRHVSVPDIVGGAAAQRQHEHGNAAASVGMQSAAATMELPKGRCTTAGAAADSEGEWSRRDSVSRTRWPGIPGGEAWVTEVRIGENRGGGGCQVGTRSVRLPVRLAVRPGQVSRVWPIREKKKDLTISYSFYNEHRNRIKSAK